MRILWIQCDELRPDALGCDATTRWAPPQTPNLDALAARGVRFTNAYCNSPVCVPSRASMLTGRYPHDLDIWHNDAVRLPMPAGVVTFPEVFEAAGYATVSFGKEHIPEHRVWQHHDPAADGMGWIWRTEIEGVVRLKGLKDVPLAGILPDDRPSPTTQVTDAALAALADLRGDWLLRASYIMPHTPVLAPREFADRFDPNDFGPAREQSPGPFEAWVAQTQLADVLTDEEILRARAHYAAVVAHLDDQIGRLLDAAPHDAIVVFDADHGANLGDCGIWQKQTFRSASHRVPQIISWPGHLEPDVRTDLCELVDRGRTLCGLTGVDPHPSWRGRDLFDGSPAPDMVFGAIGRGDADSLLYPLVGLGPDAPRRLCARTPDRIYDVSVRRFGRDLAPDDPDDPDAWPNLTDANDRPVDEARSEYDRRVREWFTPG